MRGVVFLLRVMRCICYPSTAGKRALGRKGGVFVGTVRYPTDRLQSNLPKSGAFWCVFCAREECVSTARSVQVKKSGTLTIQEPGANRAAARV